MGKALQVRSAAENASALACLVLFILFGEVGVVELILHVVVVLQRVDGVRLARFPGP
jgi:hypothetical protein